MRYHARRRDRRHNSRRRRDGRGASRTPRATVPATIAIATATTLARARSSNADDDADATPSARVGVCSSTPDRRRHDRERREDRDARGDNRDDARHDARHDEHSRAGRATVRRAHPDVPPRTSLRPSPQLNRMTASRREAAAASSPSLTVSQERQRNILVPPRASTPSVVDARDARRPRMRWRDTAAKFLSGCESSTTITTTTRPRYLSRPLVSSRRAPIRVASRRERSEEG